MRRSRKNILRKKGPKLRRRVVCFGGGNAVPKAVLGELKKYPVKITAICAMADSGGSTGRLRKDLNIISPGDIRRAFIALADTSLVMKSLFSYRFERGALKGHNFANLLIAVLDLTGKGYEQVIEELRSILNIKHDVLPVTIDNVHLCAVLENGKTIYGETNIDVPKHNPKLRIRKVFLKPKAKIYPKAAKAINEADLIVIGPGDLYSSIIQILLTEGLASSIKKSSAKKVYVCNIMTKKGETNNFKVSDFASEIEKYLKTSLDYVLFNTKNPSKKRLKDYKKNHPELIEIVKFDKSLDKKKFIGADILTDRGKIVHDSKKLIKTILKI